MSSSNYFKASFKKWHEKLLEYYYVAIVPRIQDNFCLFLKF